MSARSGKCSNPASLCHFGNSRSVIIAHLPRRRPPPPLARPIWRRVIRPHFCRRSLTGRPTTAPPVLRVLPTVSQRSAALISRLPFATMPDLGGFCQIRRARRQNCSRPSLSPLPQPSPVLASHIRSVNQTELFCAPLESTDASAFNTCQMWG